MNKIIRIIPLMAIVLLFGFSHQSNDGVFKVMDFNDEKITIGEEKVQPGMEFPISSQIKFPSKDSKLKVKPISDFKYWCKKCKKYEIWKAGERKVISSDSQTSSFNISWWLKRHKTSTKGIANTYDLVGQWMTMEIDTVLVDHKYQYYKFTVIEGPHYGFSFLAYPDDQKASAIWISRDMLPSDSESFLLKLDFHNYSEILTKADSIVINVKSE